MNQLQAMKEQGIRIDLVECEAMLVIFDNGLALPIEYFYGPDGELVDGPVEGGICTFGDDEYGWGWYPIRMITEEEFEENRRARARTALENRAHQARPN